MKEVYLRFPGPGLSLEGALALPQGEGPFPGAVVCHPHPLYGGDMDNNVVLAICQALVKKSIAALRFNFRGVGRSEGRFDQGVGEQEDVLAALGALRERQEVDSARLGLVGYSFGAAVAAAAGPRAGQVKALALISLPLVMGNLDALKDYPRAKLLVSGGRDSFVPRQGMERLAAELPPPVESEVVPETDHFWWGHEDKVAAKVAEFLCRSLFHYTS